LSFSLQQCVVVRRASFLYLAAVGVIRKLSLLSLLVAMALPVHAELPDLINRIRPGVVAVGTVKPVKRTDANSGPALKYLGTGFVVGDGLKVITNFHVMPEKLDADAMGVARDIHRARGRRRGARSACAAQRP
jgi:hypothetical protein